jgi:hypothetical protein
MATCPNLRLNACVRHSSRGSNTPQVTINTWKRFPVAVVVVGHSGAAIRNAGLGVGNELGFGCGISKSHIIHVSRAKLFLSKGKAINMLIIMKKIAPHRAVEEQC